MIDNKFITELKRVYSVREAEDFVSSYMSYLRDLHLPDVLTAKTYATTIGNFYIDAGSESNLGGVKQGIAKLEKSFSHSLLEKDIVLLGKFIEKKKEKLQDENANRQANIIFEIQEKDPSILMTEQEQRAIAEVDSDVVGGGSSAESFARQSRETLKKKDLGNYFNEGQFVGDEDASFPTRQSSRHTDRNYFEEGVFVGDKKYEIGRDLRSFSGLNKTERDTLRKIRDKIRDGKIIISSNIGETEEEVKQSLDSATVEELKIIFKGSSNAEAKALKSMIFHRIDISYFIDPERFNEGDDYDLPTETLGDLLGNINNARGVSNKQRQLDFLMDNIALMLDNSDFDEGQDGRERLDDFLYSVFLDWRRRNPEQAIFRKSKPFYSLDVDTDVPAPFKPVPSTEVYPEQALPHIQSFLQGYLNILDVVDKNYKPTKFMRRSGGKSDVILGIGLETKRIKVGKGVANEVIQHFKKDNKEMKSLAKAYETHMKVENATEKAVKRIKVGKGIDLVEEPTFRTFGKYRIHYPHLLGGTINVKYPSLASIPAFKPSLISEDYKELLIDTINSGKLNQKELQRLPKEEIRHFERLITGAGLLEHFKLKRLTGEDDKKDSDRFFLLRGEYIAGNNAPTLVKELRQLIIKFMNEGRIHKGEGLKFLTELSIV
jgi:hypothetical protein